MPLITSDNLSFPHSIINTYLRPSLPTPQQNEGKKTIKSICIHTMTGWLHNYAFTSTDMQNFIDWFEGDDTSLITPNMRVQIKFTLKNKRPELNRQEKEIAKARQ